MVWQDTFIVSVYFRFRVEELSLQESGEKGQISQQEGDKRWRENNF